MESNGEVKRKLLEFIEQNPDVKQELLKESEDSYLKNTRQPQKTSDKEKEISRRGFLKKAGLGAAGLGAAAMTGSAAGLNIKSENSFSYFNQSGSNPNLKIDSSGELKVNQISTDKLSLGNDGPATSFADIGSAGGGNGGGKYQNAVSGIVYINNKDEYVAESFATGNKWRDSSDAGIVIQRLVEDLSDGSCVRFGPGSYTISTEVTITNSGMTLEGPNRFDQRNGSAVKLINGSVGAGNAMIRFENHGGAVVGLRMDYGNEAAYCIHTYDSDRMKIEDCSLVGNDTGGSGLFIEGTYNSYVGKCLILNARFENNDDTGKGFNQVMIESVNIAASASGAQPLFIADQGNWMQNFVIAGEGKATSGTAAIGGAHDNWTFVDGTIYGSWDPHIVPDNDIFVGVRFNGGTNAIQDPKGSKFIGCWFDGASNNHVKVTSGGWFHKNIFSGCHFEEAGSDSISVKPSSVSQVKRNTISGCIFLGNGGSDIIWETDGFRRECIVGNSFTSGMSYDLGNIEVISDSIVAGNAGHNPVGRSRSTPSIPSGTGSDNTVGNPYGESVTIYQSGGSGIMVGDSTGSFSSVPDVETFTIPSGAEVYFTSSVPTSWTWYWE